MRFKEFEGQYVKYTFDDIANYKKGPFGSALKKELFVPYSIDSIKVYEQQNAIEKNYALSRYYISKEYYKKMKSFTVEPGDIIVSCAGTIGEIYTLPNEADIGVINQALMRIKPNYNIIVHDYFIYSFEKMITDFSNKFSNGSAIKNIPPFSDLKKQTSMLPCLEEQQKIVLFLHKINDRIETQKKIIEDYKALKKQIINTIYDNNSYNSKLSNLIIQVSKRNKNSINNNVLSVSNKYGFIKQSEQFEEREVASDDISNYKIISKDIFAYNPARINVGSIAKYNNEDEGIVSPMYICFETNDTLLPEYLNYYFDSNEFKYQMSKRLEGSVKLHCFSP